MFIKEKAVLLFYSKCIFVFVETAHGRLRRQLGEPLDERVTVTSSCFTVTSDNRFIITCGYWDKSFKCFSTETGKKFRLFFNRIYLYMSNISQHKFTSIQNVFLYKLLKDLSKNFPT